MYDFQTADTARVVDTLIAARALLNRAYAEHDATIDAYGIDSREAERSFDAVQEQRAEVSRCEDAVAYCHPGHPAVRQYRRNAA